MMASNRQEPPDRGVDPAMLRALTEAGASLARIDGVKGFDIGQNDAGEHTIRVMVLDLEDAPVDLPGDIDGYPVHVVQGAPVLCSADSGRYDPVLGGVEVAQAASGVLARPSGTLGCVLRDAATLAPVGISCTHVLAGTDPTAIFLQDEIWQPNAIGQRLGGLLRWEMPLQPPFFAGGFPTGFWDAAVCTVDRNASVGEIAEIGRVTGIGSARIGDHVLKRGSSTRVTHGTVTGLFGSYLISHHSAPTAWWMLGQIEITVIPDLSLNPKGVLALEGDSGSAVINNDGELVGLLHAGGTGSTAYAMDFGPMAVALGVVL